MKTIYVDPIDFKCHLTDDGTRIAVETDFFDGKCDGYIAGYRFIPRDYFWTRSDGTVFWGEMVTPWKAYGELLSAQLEYEETLLADAENALAILLGGETP